MGDDVFDEALDALGDVQCRRILFALLDHEQRSDGPIDPRDVTVGNEDPERLAIRLHHVHLPKLEEYGYIDWDREANGVTEGPMFDEIRPFLRLLGDHPDELPDGWLQPSRSV